MINSLKIVFIFAMLQCFS